VSTHLELNNARSVPENWDGEAFTKPSSRRAVDFVEAGRF